MMFIKKCLIGMITVIMIAISIRYNSKIFSQIKDQNYKNNPYYGVMIEEQTKENIEGICEYIKEKNKAGIEVKIISYYANLYMNVLQKNNGQMDLPFIGNLGAKGEDGLIEEINQLKNTKLLVLKEEDKRYQESKKVRDHIMNSFEKEGEIAQFYIYQTSQ